MKKTAPGNRWGKGPIAFSLPGRLILACLLYLPAARAQVEEPDSSTMQMDSIQWLPTDSTTLDFFTLADPGLLQPAEDTTLQDFQQYDPARRQWIDWANLGNLGSPANPFWYTAPERQGFSDGLDAFRLYNYRLEDTRFYRLAKSYTHLQFNRGLNQEDNAFQALFSRNFKNRLNLGFQYARTNALGAYTFNRSRNTNLSIGFWYTGKKGRYESFLVFLLNGYSRQENGGITTDTLFGKAGFDVKASIPVALAAANSRYSEKVYSSRHLYRFGKAGFGQQGGLQASYGISYGDLVYKYYDPDAANRAAYYGAQLTDPRGVRQFLEYDYLENTLGLSWSLQRRIREDTSRIQIAAGIRHKIIWLRQEPLEEDLNNLFLTGELSMNYRKNIRLSAQAYLGLASSLGDAGLSPSVRIAYPGLGSLQVDGQFRVNEAGLIQRRAFITQVPVWDQDFQKEKVYSIQGRFNIEKLRFTAFGGWHILDDYVYFDAARRSRQANATLQILQLGAQHHLRLGAFHIENTVGLQQISDKSLFRGPGFFSRHGIYHETPLFKRATTVQYGFNLRFFSAFSLNGYDPVMGQFYLQESYEAYPLYPYFDFYLSARIQSFRGFVKLENIGNLVNGEVLFHTAAYPQPDWLLRFGVSWTFKD